MSVQLTPWRAKICALLALLFFLVRPAATHALDPPPPLTYFSWQSTGANAYAATAGSVHGTALLAIPGNDVIEPRSLTATAPSFVAQYGAALPTMATTNGVAGSAANSVVQFSFNNSLPTGSRLIVLDVDIALYDERFELSQVGGALTLLDQLESNSGASSVFPSWMSLTGILRAQGTQNNNNYEATVFDVSGASVITARFLRNSGGGGIAGAHLVIGVPVPEPTAAWLSTIALTWLMLRIARNNCFARPSVRC